MELKEKETMKKQTKKERLETLYELMRRQEDLERRVDTEMNNLLDLMNERTIIQRSFNSWLLDMLAGEKKL